MDAYRSFRQMFGIDDHAGQNAIENLASGTICGMTRTIRLLLPSAAKITLGNSGVTDLEIR